MSSRRYTTEFVIKGDSTSAVQASRDLQRANSDLAREVQNTERRSEEMAASFESVSMHAQRLATFTAAATAATGAMVVSQTRNIAEQAAFARAVGVSVQTLQQWEFAAKAAGMQSGAIGDIFKDTAEKIGDFVNTGGGEAADLFEVLNLNIRDLMDLSPDKQLLAVANAFDEVGNRGAKIAFLESLGNDATLLLPLLENNAELLREQLGIADQLSVAIPQSDVDSIEAANQALNELTALASGFSSTVAANFAPAIVAVSQGAQQFIEDFGGMSEVVDKVATGTLLVSGVLAGRLAGSMATATAATIAKISAERAHIAALAEQQAMEAARAATLARTASNLQSIAAQRAASAAQEAAQERNAAAMDAQRLQRLQAQLAAEKTLAAQRLGEQTNAAGRMQVQARINQLHTAELGAINQLTAANGRLAQAEATETAAKKLASAASLEKARADTAATTATGAYTTAATAAARANGVLATSGRVAAGALALVGGPLGAAVLAGAGIYAFREELGLTIPQIDANTTAVDKLTAGLDNMNEAAAQLTLTSLVGRLAEVRAQAEATAQEITKVGQIEGDGGGGFLGVDVTAQTDAVRELGATSNETQQEAANLEAAIALVETRLGKLGERNREVTPTITSVGDAAEAAARKAQQAAEAQAKALVGLQQEMDPLLADHAEYIERLAVLDRALAEGTISEEAYGEAVRWNAEQYQRAATGAEEYEKQTAALVGKYDSHRQKVEALATELQQINERYAAGEIGGAQYARMVEGVREAQYELALETNDLAQILDDMVENTGQRLDDAGVEMFKGLLTGAGDAMDQLEDLLISSIAEIGNALLLRPLTVQITGQLQGLLGQQVTGLPAQGGAGGFNLGSLGSLKNGWDTVSGWLGGGSAASGGLYANALTGSAAAGGLYAGASTGAAVGGLYGNALTGAATTASGGFMSAVGSAMPWIGAGLLVDNLLGLGITDGIVEGISSIFGGGKSDPRLNISTRGDAGQFSHESVRTGAFGAVGFSEGTKRSNDLFGSVEQEREWLASVAALDNLTAAAARTPEQLDAMTAAVQNMVITSEDAQGAIDQLAGRTAAATSVIDSELTQSLIDAGATAEQIAQRFATASSTIDVISAASARLNLQYDAGADGALRYADSLVQAFGSVENIVAIQDAYYNAAFSDQERLQNQYDDVRSALSGLTDEAPRTVEELRAIVEASKLNGEASQKLAYDLMALAPALKQTSQAVRDAITQQYQDVLGRAPAAEGLNYWFDQVASGALTLEGALSSIANSTERLAMDNQAIWDNITSSLEDQYQNTLERDANADDLYYWMTQIESGAVTLDGALAQISNSVEYHATLWQGFESEIAAAYEQSLGRVANGGEMRYWLQQIEAGAVTLDGALSQIAGSIEAAEFDAAGGAAGLRERAQLNRQLLQAQGNTEALRALELEALHEANRPLQERIWALQDEQKALREAEQNQQRYNQALESAQSAFASFSVGIDDWLAQLRGTEQGLGSPADQLAATSEAFEEQFAKALTGDRDALGSITQYADRFIEAQKGWSASGMLTTSTIDRVSGMLESLPDLLSPEEFLAEEFRNALGDQSDTLSAAFDASTAAAVSALIPKFDAIDTNTDGLLTFSELSAALAGKATDAEIRALISRVDANGDGMISEQELANYRLGRVASDIGSELEPMFDAIDLNTDGLIDYAEFGRYFSGLATDAELKNIFRTLDADGDGQISRLEAIKGSSQNTDNQTDSLARFFDRAGNPSWGLRVSMSYHQDESAIQSIGWHVANEIAAMAANGQYVDKFANGGVFSGGVQAFANGGVFTNAIVSSPTLFNMGLMGEEDPEAIVPLSRGAGGRLGIDATGLMRLPDGPLDLPMPNVQMPQFPALGGSDVVQVLNDLRNENKQLRNDINRLLGSSNTHLAAANVQRGAAATQQIAATKEGNKMLKKMQDDARLEAAKR